MQPAALTLAALAPRPLWVGWRKETRDGRPTKVPYDPRTGARAKSTDPATWATRDEAEFWAVRERGDGVGLVLSRLDDDTFLCGIDLDACRDPDAGDIAPWAQEIIDRANSYTEVSPSGTGVKIFCAHRSVDLPAIEAIFDGQHGRQFKRAGGDHPPAIEIYRGERYFAATDEAIGPREDLRFVGVADLQWLICEAGPKFAGARRAATAPTRAARPEHSAPPPLSAGSPMTRCAPRCSGMRDPDVAEWARTKGLANGERELRRIYDKVGGEPR